VRERSKILVAFGDCAVTSNVPGMRNPIGIAPLLARAYLENVDINPMIPNRVVPMLLPTSQPLNRFVDVDVFLPGCPPHADLIYSLLDDLLSGKTPDVAGARFGR
jgi:NAD-reducing hydrogenase small subunit